MNTVSSGILLRLRTLRVLLRRMERRDGTGKTVSISEIQDRGTAPHSGASTPSSVMRWTKHHPSAYSSCSFRLSPRIIGSSSDRDGVKMDVTMRMRGSGRPRSSFRSTWSSATWLGNGNCGTGGLGNKDGDGAEDDGSDLGLSKGDDKLGRGGREGRGGTGGGGRFGDGGSPFHGGWMNELTRLGL